MKSFLCEPLRSLRLCVKKDLEIMHMTALMNMLTTFSAKKWTWTAFIILFILIGLEFFAILSLNSGLLTYSLDDAYIHLALAENIFKGHYGVNLCENSAASSSIIWPVLLAPLTALPKSHYAPLLLNVLSVVGVFIIFIKTIACALRDYKGSHKDFYIASIALFLIPATNLVGILFTGMEHTLQLFMALLILYGLFREIELKRVPWFLLFAIVFAPLVRYENLAISLPALLYLFLVGHRGKSILTGLVTGCFLFGFSLYLMRLGLEPFPTSILAKSAVVSTGGARWLGHLKESLLEPRGLLLALGLVTFMSFSIFSTRSSRERLFAAAMAIGLLLHLLVGRYGWYNRYEIYIWGVLLLSLVYLFRHHLCLLESKWQLFKFYVVGGVFLLLICYPYIKTLKTTPTAANNIYEQHYQMHRFAKYFYKKAVAVNDLGYVAYQNSHYILDLYGLASVEALESRINEKLQASRGDAYDTSWISELTRRYDVKCAMIYDDWFVEMPDTWSKVAEMKLSRRQITPARDTVAFYVLEQDRIADTILLLEQFGRTLPRGVQFNILNIATPEE